MGQIDYGQWPSPDPAGLGAVSLANPQSWNAYAYAGNNPTTNTDPSGEDYNVCVNNDNGDPQCTHIQNEALVQAVLANPGTGITVKGSESSGTIYGTDANGNQVQVGTYTQVVGPGTEAMESGGVSDASVPLVGLVATGVNVGAALGEAAINGIGRMLGVGAEEAAPVAGSRLVGIGVDEVVQKASSAVGGQSVTVANEGVAQQAADQFLGPGKEVITDRTTGTFKGWKSADGTRVVIGTHHDALGAHMNFRNLLTGSNLHVRW